jgi:hypothetical protein
VRPPTFANVIALLALFVALGDSSYAALSVGSKQIVDNSVRSKDLRNNEVRGHDTQGWLAAAENTGVPQLSGEE